MGIALAAEYAAGVVCSLIVLSRVVFSPMTLEHEYAVLGGYNRTHVGRWLYAAAALISAVIVFLVLSSIDLARTWGLNVNLPPTALSLVSAGAVYAALYWFFSRYAWKFGPLSGILRLPDLSGQWICEGIPIRPGKGQPWTGRITVVQSWDRLQIHVETEQSISDSIAAALQYDAGAGYHLMYHYRNQPRARERRLAPHHGFAEISFSRDLQSGSGDYFNGRGRNTFGTMAWTREPA